MPRRVGPIGARRFGVSAVSYTGGADRLAAPAGWFHERLKKRTRCPHRLQERQQVPACEVPRIRDEGQGRAARAAGELTDGMPPAHGVWRPATETLLAGAAGGNRR